MQLGEILSLSKDSLIGNPLRTSLSLLGITIGTAAVIMVGAAARSGHAVIFDELMTFGLRSVWVFPDSGNERPGHVPTPGTGITLEDIEAIERECLSVARITPITQDMVWATSNGHYRRVRLQAVNHQLTAIAGDDVKAGRLLSWADVRAGSLVAVIGPDVAQDLYPSSDPLGKQIRLDRKSFTVVGILEERTRDFLNSVGITNGGIPNERVLVPITAYYKVAPRREVHYLQAEAVEPAGAEIAAQEIINILSRRHQGKYRYRFQVMQRYIDTAEEIIHTVSWLGGIAAAVSLLVGGIGIMNVLSTSVIERTSEIGLRKAVGARRRDILFQFLTEAILLCLLGGLSGVLLGAATIILIEHLSDKPKLLAWEYVLAAMLVSLITGVLAGLYPASRAAAQDPIEALRYE